MEPTEQQLAELQMTREEWDGLAPSERDALLTDASESDGMTLGEASELDAARAALGDGGDGQEGSEPEAKKPDGEAGDSAAGGEAGDGTSPLSGGEGDGADDQPPPAVGLPTQEQIDAEMATIKAARESAEAKRKEIEAKLDELDTQLDAGDITTVEYNRAKRPLDNEMFGVVRAEAKADADEASIQRRVTDAQAAYRAAMVQRWNDAQKDFFADEPNAPLYRDEKRGAEARQHFQQQAQFLASLPENQSKGMTWFLREADLRVRGIMAVKAAGTDPLRIPGNGNEPPRKPRSADLSGVPPSLGTLPPASRDVPAGKYAEIDSLKGEAYLAALDRMSDAEREAYTATQ